MIAYKFKSPPQCEATSGVQSLRQARIETYFKPNGRVSVDNNQAGANELPSSTKRKLHRPEQRLRNSDAELADAVRAHGFRSWDKLLTWELVRHGGGVAPTTTTHLTSFNAQNLANTAWAFAKLGILNDEGGRKPVQPRLKGRGCWKSSPEKNARRRTSRQRSCIRHWWPRPW